RRVLAEVHVGIAVDTADGLIVPVLRDAHRLDAAALEREARTLIEAARARSLAPERLRGATILLSNFGPIGGRYATPIVVPPAVAILGAGRISLAAVASEDGSLAAHRVLPLSLTFDHRAVTGGEAARFLNAVIVDLQRAE
ncbi:MAG TPA: 2-oxo acid dehydrogenase subunit E2, partial [Burkholderiaceae bacterium]|nr:2-oxo acid dehydrogenase subunit E2 [Burkholderiaceae bacterium]